MFGFLAVFRGFGKTRQFRRKFDIMFIDQKTLKLLQSLKGKKVGVFCDDSNLYHSYKKYGWRINFEKFRKLLESYCNLRFINYHVAIPDRTNGVLKDTENFLQKIAPFVSIRKKRMKYIPVDGKITKKGGCRY